MDTSETYIKMMIQAWEDIKSNIPIGVILFSRRQRMLCILDGKVVRWSEKITTSNVDRAVPLLEQDQLQEMIEGLEKYDTSIRSITLACAFARFLGIADEDAEGRSNINIRKGSMEQLWLAFVMKEKYGKVWNGTDWEEVIWN